MNDNVTGTFVSGRSGAGRSHRRRPLWHGRSRFFNAVLTVSLIGSLLTVLGVGMPMDVGASVPPLVDSDDLVATAEGLPTVQINGIIWDQAIIGDVVYAGGSFSKARPAGSPVGSNEVSRSNMLAYNIKTGELINSFAPVFNNDIRVIEPAPDGSRLYVGGTFTNVNGISQYRLTALDPVTGAVDTVFSGVLDYRVSAIAVTESTVYVGGRFNTAASFSAPPSPSTPRANLAAFDRQTGYVLPWNPGTDAEVLGLTTAAGGSRVFAAGRFSRAGGSTNRGTAAIEAGGAGNVIPWAANGIVYGSGNNAAIYSISSDGDSVYGTGYHYGSGGNLEGTFSANALTGEVNWVQDCHGDTYDSAPINGTVYTVSHVHYCGNIGGFPQSSPWSVNQRYALAITDHATGTNRRDIWNYPNWAGTPAPSLVAWYPEFGAGNVVGQATWTVEGNDDYVIVGGEFLLVNGKRQQGLVRFANRSSIPGSSGPLRAETNWELNLQSYSTGEVRISFPANIDRDDHRLKYEIIRDGNNSEPIYTTEVESVYWDRPSISYTDTGLAPGSIHTYRVRATDKDGNRAWGPVKSITVASTGSSSPYADAVSADQPRLYWRFKDPSGSTTASAGAGAETGSVGNKSYVTFNQETAMLNEPSDRSASFTNNVASHVSGSFTDVIDSFTLEAWVKTNSNYGGRIIGFSSSEHGTSGTRDRMLYMNNNGSVTFGAYPGSTKTITSRTGLNDNKWHHVVGTLGDDGMHLYIDGVLNSSNRGSDYTGGQGYNGYWRVGGDSLSGWPGTHTRNYLTGLIDEPAVYTKVLAPSRVAAHYEASGRSPALPSGPSDAYGSQMRASDPVFYYRLDEGSGSTANDSGIRSAAGAYVNTVGRSATGAIAGNTAARFTGSGFVRSAAYYDPGNYSAQAWFRSNSSSGGQIIGFGNSATGTSSVSDRQVVMTDTGQIAFNSGGSTVTTDAEYNDDAWHHVVATQGASGMKLYVDGSMVGSSSRAVGRVLTGYWRIGSDNVNGLSSSNGFVGMIDEVAVHDRVLTGSEIVSTYLAGGGEVPNLAPIASFTSSTNFLDVSLDASSSTDPDGSIVSYEWDFGDGGTATGASVAHTYAEAGSYVVTLTVTDDRGGTGTTSEQVTVEPEPANIDPIPDFSITTNGLSVAVNASTSIDPDGSIVSYEWDFGDGGTATGVSTTHAYTEAGSYSVELTVTDDRGGTGNLIKTVTVEEPAGSVVYGFDSFSRTTTNGWGSADQGGQWTVEGPIGLASTNAASGLQRLDIAGRTSGAHLYGLSARDVLGTVEMSIDKPLTGSGIYSYMMVRDTPTGKYQMRIKARATETSIALFRTINGTTTTLASQNLAGLLLVPGRTYNISFSAQGALPTVLDASIWDAESEQPDVSQVHFVDDSGLLQDSGGVGLVNYLTGSATNAPLTVSYDNLMVASGPEVETPPQPNVPPVAAFTGSVSGMEVTVDASASSDPDGSIESYAWSFGDGTVASGAQATHTYTQPGSYVVALTVTDDSGDSDVAIQSIVIESGEGPLLVAGDNFERQVNAGWGDADIGGSWLTDGPVGLAFVTGGAGVHNLDVAGRTVGTRLTGFDASDVQGSVDISIDKPLTGGGIYSYLALRQTGNNDYTLRIRMKTNLTNLAIFRTVNGVATVIGSVDLPFVITPDNVYRVSFSVNGTSPTTLGAKLWNKSDGEPLADDLVVNDSTSALQTGGRLGLSNYLTGSAANAPVAVRYDDLEVR